jgi:hypothetical protein
MVELLCFLFVHIPLIHPPMQIRDNLTRAVFAPGHVAVLKCNNSDWGIEV